MRIFTTSRADRDLHAIYGYLTGLNPKAADAFLHRVDVRFQQLARFPFIGRMRPSLAPGLRSVLVDPYVVFYMVSDDRITIARVLDGRMDLDEELKR